MNHFGNDRIEKLYLTYHELDNINPALLNALNKEEIITFV